MPNLKILVDGSHLAHRANHVFKSLRSATYQETGLIYGFLKTLFSLKKRFQKNNAQFVIFWDNNPVVKKTIFPEYKAHRSKENISGFFNQLSILRNLLLSLGVNQAQVEYEEADDLISSYIFSDKSNCKFMIYSADKDFLQLVSSQVLVVKPKMGNYPEVIYTEKKVLEEFGLLPQGIIFLKVFTGDSSDNIPGIKRFPKKQLIKILDHVQVNGISTIDQIFEKLESFKFLTEKQYLKIKAFYDQAFKNFELIKLKEHLDINILKQEYNSRKVQEHFQKLEFFEFLREFKKWEALFGGGTNEFC